MAGPIRFGNAKGNLSGAFRLELDQKDFQRGRDLLDRYQGKSLNIRMQKATLAAAKSLEPAMRLATPVAPEGTKDRGHLRRKTRAQQLGQRTGWKTYYKSVNADVGPRSPHRHLVIRGHRIVTRSGRDTGRRSRANPYVDVVAQRHYARAVAEMRRYIFDQNYSRVF